MKSRLTLALAGATLVPFMSFCAHDSGRTSSIASGDHKAVLPETDDYDYHRDPSTPKPFYLGQAVHHEETTAAVVPPPPPPAAAPVQAAKDPCVADTLSTGAVGRPCLTTAEFIKSLGLSPKRQARALAMVLRADQRLAH